MNNEWPPRGFQTDSFGVTEEKTAEQPKQTYTPTHEWSATEQPHGYSVPTYPVHESAFTSKSLREYAARCFWIFVIIFMVFCGTAFLIGLITGVAKAL